MPLSLATYGLLGQNPQTVPTLLDYAKGRAAGFAGTPGDVLDLIKLGQAMKQGYIPDNEPSKLSSDGLGQMMGADTSSPAFIAGTFGDPLNMWKSAILAAPKILRRIGRIDGFDPRFDPRIKEQERLRNLHTTVEGGDLVVPEVSIYDLEGQPFITSMSDRTAAGGQIVGVNDVPLEAPIDRLGGQDHMFLGQQVWASNPGPANQIHGLAGDVKRLTGKDPVLLPWRMAPTGSDFSTTTGELMISYASASMDAATKQALDTAIRDFRTVGDMIKGKRVGAGLGIKGWKGVDHPDSIKAWRDAPDRVRKELKNMMDVNFRDKGGMSIGEARLAIADPEQLMAPDAGLMNVGRIDSDAPIITSSGHPSYEYGVPGEGMGRLSEDVNAFQLLPDVVRQRGIDPLAPRQTDIRSLQMKPFGGILTEEILRRLEP